VAALGRRERRRDPLHVWQRQSWNCVLLLPHVLRVFRQDRGLRKTFWSQKIQRLEGSVSAVLGEIHALL